MTPSLSEVLAEAERASARGEACRGEALGRRALRMAGETGVDPAIVRDKLAEMYARRAAFDASLPERARGTKHRIVDVTCDCSAMQPDVDTLQYRASAAVSISLLLLVPEAMSPAGDAANVVAPLVEAILANANLFVAAKQPGEPSYVAVRSLAARERTLAEVLRAHVLETLAPPALLPSALFVVESAKLWPLDAATFVDLAGEPMS